MAVSREMNPLPLRPAFADCYIRHVNRANYPALAVDKAENFRLSDKRSGLGETGSGSASSQTSCTGTAKAAACNHRSFPFTSDAWHAAAISEEPDFFLPTTIPHAIVALNHYHAAPLSLRIQPVDIRRVAREQKPPFHTVQHEAGAHHRQHNERHEDQHHDIANPNLWHEDRRQENRSEEHTSELQSRGHLVCPLLLEKKNK